MDGFRLIPGRLDRRAQHALLTQVLALVDQAPLFRPSMPRTGTPLSVRMTNLGPLGWVSDRSGYRYQPTHPETGRPWPAMPETLLALWRELAHWPAPPEACLVNVYDDKARLGLHVDADELAVNAPVVSVSLGDDALFRLGGLKRSDPTKSLWLKSGDVVVLGGAARRAYHGVDRLRPGTSTLIPGGGRINLTLRRVNLEAGPALADPANAQ